MVKTRFTFACARCSSVEEHLLDLDDDADVALVGMVVARLMDDAHVVLAAPSGYLCVGMGIPATTQNHN